MPGLNNVSVRSSINGETPLHQVAYRADLAAAKLLLDARADVNARNDYSETPFFKAIRGRYVYQIYEEEKHYYMCSEEGGCSEDEQYEPLLLMKKRLL